MKIRYVSGDSRLGKVLVAATDKDICAVRLGESENGIEKSLVTEFRDAELKRDDTGLKRQLYLVLARVSGRGQRSMVVSDAMIAPPAASR